MGFELTPTALRDFHEIPEDWKMVTLQSIADIFDCPHSTPLLTDSGPYLVRTQDVRSGTLELDLLARVSEETYLERVKRAIPKFGDLLYSREGTYFGSAAMVPIGAKVCLGQRMVHIRPDSSNIDHVFLKYWLNSPVMARHISGLRDGTVAERLNMSTIRALPVAFPDLLSQIVISSALRSLDDRIDLLRQINTTLEAITQALFKSWFVDFDPVHAKAVDREPDAMDAATAALFPSELEESELGLIPKGWRVTKVGELAELVKGCSYKGAGLSEADGASMFNLGCFNAKRIFATEKIKRYTGTYRERHAVVEGDLIVANTDMTPHRVILGRPLFVPAGFEPGFVSHHVFKVAPMGENKAHWKHFLFFAFQQPAFRERAVGYATGTTVLALARDSAEKCPIVDPGKVVLIAFSELVTPLLTQIANNLQREKSLELLRDTLLPRLISGKLRLQDGEREIEATA